MSKAELAHFLDGTSKRKAKTVFSSLKRSATLV
jgi:hypothetical protein